MHHVTTSFVPCSATAGPDVPGNLLVRFAATGLSAAGERAVAFTTALQLSADGWSDTDGPLLYQFQYTLPPVTPEEAASPPPPVVLAAFQPSPSARATLPAGPPEQGGLVIVQLCVKFSSLVFRAESSHDFTPPLTPEARPCH